MRHFPGSRVIAGVLALMGMFATPIAQAQSWAPVAGDYQGGVVRGLFVPSLSNASAIGDSWTAIYYGGMFKQAAGSSTWTPINNGLTDKRVYGFAITSSVNPYRGYAATTGGGVFKTVDGGANWSAVNNGLGCLYVRGVAFIGVSATASTAATSGVGSTASNDRLLVNTGCGANSNVYVSVDGGANWNVTSGIPSGWTVINVTRVNPAGSGVDFLMASTYAGIYKSTDDGLTWTLSNGAISSPNGPNVNNVTYLYSGNPAALTMYAAEANTGVWKSIDNGFSWGSAPIFSKITSSGVSTDGSDNGNLYFEVDGEGIYKSADKGNTWALFATGAALPGARLLVRNSTSSGSPIYYAGTYAGVYRSGDSGVTWSKASDGLPGGFTINQQTDSSGNVYTAGAEGVYKAVPGGRFQRLGGNNLGIFWSGGHVIVTPTDVPYAITSYLGVFKFDGTNWVPKNTGLPNMVRQGGVIRSDPKNVNGLYVGLSLGGGIYYSADGGDSWSAKNSGRTGGALSILTMSVTSAFIVISTSAGVYKSVDDGDTWIRLPFPAKSSTNVELPISRLRIDPGNGTIYSTVIQTDRMGIAFSDNGVWKSNDGGATWTQSLAGKLVQDVIVARKSSGVTLYAALWDLAGGGVMQSTDEGVTWTAMNTALTSRYVQNFGISGGSLSGVSSLDEGVQRFIPPATAESLKGISGWNLFGNGMSTSIAVASAFNDASKISTVWKWLPATSKWAFYTPSLSDGGAAYAASKGYDFLTSIAAGEGFWVNATGAISAPLTGTAVASTSFKTALTPGWTLLATGDRPTPSAFNRLIASSDTPPTPGVVPTSVTTLWGWDPTKANWYFYAPSLEANGGLVAYIASKKYLDFGGLVLDPTAGLWVNKP